MIISSFFKTFICFFVLSYEHIYVHKVKIFMFSVLGIISMSVCDRKLSIVDVIGAFDE
jgi:hypothetical protein